MGTRREQEKQQFEKELRKASDNCNDLSNDTLSQKSPCRSLNVQSPCKTLKSPSKYLSQESPQKSLLSTIDGTSGNVDHGTGVNIDLEFEEEFEEDLEKEEEEEENNDDEDSEDGDEDEMDFCRNCLRLMSHMRKSAVRWLYMEWYKKAVLGQHLPTVSLLNVFKLLFP